MSKYEKDGEHHESPESAGVPKDVDSQVGMLYGAVERGHAGISLARHKKTGVITAVVGIALAAVAASLEKQIEDCTDVEAALPLIAKLAHVKTHIADGHPFMPLGIMLPKNHADHMGLLADWEPIDIDDIQSQKPSRFPSPSEN